MRFKFLSIIASFLFLSIAISSCLDSGETNYEFSSDATVRAFGIDTIHGKYYKFTIDQLRRLIYNRDSLPVGSDTIIDKILIDTFSVTGGITTGALDTLFVMTDSVDLRPAMNPKSDTEGMKFKIHAADGVTTREYTLQVRVHLQDPDSLTWKNMEEAGSIFSTTINRGEQKALLWEEDGAEYLLVYTPQTSMYKTSVNEYSWSEHTLTGLPADARPSSTICFRNRLYMATTGGDVYTSDNGTDWNKSDGLSGNVTALIACFPQNEMTGLQASLAGIVDTEGKHFCTTVDGELWSIHELVPEEFPIGNFSYTTQTSATGVDEVLVVGTPATAGGQTIPWFSLDGKGWADMAPTTSTTACPALSLPSILYYGGDFYCWGGNLDAIYTSLNGIAWYKTESKFLLPEAFEGKGSYSMAIDKNQCIWMVFGGEGTPNEVWRGRLNRLGFKEQ